MPIRDVAWQHIGWSLAVAAVFTTPCRAGTTAVTYLKPRDLEDDEDWKFVVATRGERRLEAFLDLKVRVTDAGPAGSSSLPALRHDRERHGLGGDDAN